MQDRGHRRGRYIPGAVPVLHMPADGEVLGTVSKIAGASRFVVECKDGNERLCSIPGRFKRRFWIKINDMVIVKPWTVQSNERGDIIWRFTPQEVLKLRDKGVL